jgi:hypothetical protein
VFFIIRSHNAFFFLVALAVTAFAEAFSLSAYMATKFNGGKCSGGMLALRVRSATDSRMYGKIRAAQYILEIRSSSSLGGNFSNAKTPSQTMEK